MSKQFKIEYLKVVTVIVLLFVIAVGCQQNDDPIEEIVEDEVIVVVEEPVDDTYVLPGIDLNNWKVTLPIGNPTEVKPPEILNYATNEVLKPFFYNDSVNGALVFYTYPGASTANSSYSRTELREQMVPGSNNTNWTFKQGGSMKGTLSIAEISKDADGDYHRVIIMQIHGRLTNTQRDLIGQKDNNAPPMLKIYWTDGKVRVKTKILKDLNASDTELLETDAWGDDDGYTFEENVGFKKFTLEIKVTEGKMEVILNATESVVYDDIHIQKWSVFENYFKAGNYLVTKDAGSFSKVNYYDLTVSH
ncbi:polysaccharide lyase family 7 protein [Aureibaculum sp. A20]|uniref:Polysaccharide lyase family 7 protein n=1 Tax=Aureibaculum flavum TaxID=2795986 RepID=A0ABS0WWC1_9FLAO|nr:MULTISPECIES: polysaccharide lyase family 7 protein [Aureibaculum]MBJ2176215.1 polysaccharide lyase family 7 protein [Aureibaculum flavum]